MTLADDAAAVIALACLTEDRTRGEQAALRRWAKKVDRERNANIVTNKRMWGLHAGTDRAVRQLSESRLLALVEETKP